MSRIWLASLLFSARSLPNQCTDDECPQSVKGNALLQMRGLSTTKTDSEADGIPNLPNSEPVIWLDEDPSWVSNDTILSEEGSSDVSEETHLRKLLNDAMVYVAVEEGKHAAETLVQALQALTEGGVQAITSNHTYLHAVEGALSLMSEEMESDIAQKYGDVITVEDWMAVRGQTENGEEKANCVQGDMCMPDNASKSLLIDRIAAGYRSAVVLFDATKPIRTCINPEGSSAEKTRIWGLAQQQMRNMVPCVALQFEEVDFSIWNDECDIKVCDGPPGVCSSSVGKQPALPLTIAVTLGGGCENMGITVHELGHAVGMYHEQSRSDRDDHVLVHWDNIKTFAKTQFITMGAEDTSIPYDLGSIMHYGTHSFSKAGAITISGTDTEHAAVMGNRMGLAHSDVIQLASMYGCSQHIDTVCPSDACIQHECVCHQTAGDSPIVKQMRDGCSRCVEQCPDSGGSDCACPMGCKVLSRDDLTYCVTEGTTSCLTNEPIDFAAPAPAPASRICKDFSGTTFCSKYVKHCSNKAKMIRARGGKQIKFAAQACMKTCGCCGGCS